MVMPLNGLGGSFGRAMNDLEEAYVKWHNSTPMTEQEAQEDEKLGAILSKARDALRELFERERTEKGIWCEKYNALREATQANAEYWEREKAAGYESEVGAYIRPWHMVPVSDIEFSIGDRVRVVLAEKQ
jgi:dsDNA-binding SOS-regulon protein